jgi:helicase MOV-10
VRLIFTFFSLVEPFRSFSVNIPTNCYLSARTTLQGKISFDSHKHRGRYQDRLELVFYDVPHSKSFAIVKPLLVIVGDSQDYEMLKPIAPYIPNKRRQREAVNEVTAGERPPALAAIEWVVKLPAYDIPKSLKTILEMTTMKEKIRLIRSGFVPRQFTSESHARLFHVLLHIEEHQSA